MRRLAHLLVALALLVTGACAAQAQVTLTGAGTASYPVTSAGPCPFGTTFADGCPGAPTGSILFPAMRASYAHVPTWNVPGWEYAVGPPAGQVFKVPGVDACPANVSCDGANKLFRVGAGAIIDGWGFDNGWGIYPDDGCSNVTVKNSKFKQVSTDYGLLRLTNSCTPVAIRRPWCSPKTT